MLKNSALLTDEDRTLLLKVSDLLEQITETLEILEDDETIASTKEAEEDVKAGRLRQYEEFIAELRRSGKIQPQSSENLRERIRQTGT